MFNSYTRLKVHQTSVQICSKVGVCASLARVIRMIWKPSCPLFIILPNPNLPFFPFFSLQIRGGSNCFFFALENITQLTHV